MKSWKWENVNMEIRGKTKWNCWLFERAKCIFSWQTNAQNLFATRSTDISRIRMHSNILRIRPRGHPSKFNFIRPLINTHKIPNKKKIIYIYKIYIQKENQIIEGKNVWISILYAEYSVSFPRISLKERGNSTDIRWFYQCIDCTYRSFDFNCIGPKKMLATGLEYIFHKL